uniref:Uncharacterized protein n=1 Tax=Rhizophora mucronata TaxID=61149 RepID=A0A2P2K0K1_RHIMU
MGPAKRYRSFVFALWILLLTFSLLGSVVSAQELSLGTFSFFLCICFFPYIIIKSYHGYSYLGFQVSNFSL